MIVFWPGTDVCGTSLMAIIPWFFTKNHPWCPVSIRFRAPPLRTISTANRQGSWLPCASEQDFLRCFTASSFSIWSCVKKPPQPQNKETTTKMKPWASQLFMGGLKKKVQLLVLLPGKKTYPPKKNGCKLWQTLCVWHILILPGARSVCFFFFWLWIFQA